MSGFVPLFPHRVRATARVSGRDLPARPGAPPPPARGGSPASGGGTGRVGGARGFVRLIDQLKAMAALAEAAALVHAAPKDVASSDGRGSGPSTFAEAPPEPAPWSLAPDAASALSDAASARSHAAAASPDVGAGALPSGTRSPPPRAASGEGAASPAGPVRSEARGDRGSSPPETDAAAEAARAAALTEAVEAARALARAELAGQLERLEDENRRLRTAAPASEAPARAPSAAALDQVRAQALAEARAQALAESVEEARALARKEVAQQLAGLQSEIERLRRSPPARTATPASEAPLAQALAEAVSQAVAAGTVAPEAESALRDAVARAASAAAGPSPEALAQRDSQIQLLERKVARLANALEQAERQRDQAQQLAASLEAQGLVPARNVVPVGLQDGDPQRERKLALMKTIRAENRALRTALGLPVGALAPDPEPVGEPVTQGAATSAPAPQEPAPPAAMTGDAMGLVDPAEASAAGDAIDPDDLDWEVTPLELSEEDAPGAVRRIAVALDASPPPRLTAESPVSSADAAVAVDEVDPDDLEWTVTPLDLDADREEDGGIERIDVSALLDRPPPPRQRD